jgi:peptidoglycan/LPS O-acetylase OafA/YrhL
MRPPLGHVPALDGLRGIAILMVIAVHAVYYSGGQNAWDGGTLGVDLFFVLSGFLITCLLLDEWSASRSISFAHFYERRARRLLPALLALVLGAACIDAGAAGRSLLLAAVRLRYATNFFNTYRPEWVGVGFGHLWSLAQEEQFYLLWPPLLLVLLRRRASPQKLLAFLGAAFLAVNADRITLIATGSSAVRIWNMPDTHGDAILAGCAAAVVWTYRLRPVSRAAGIGSAMVTAAACIWFDQTRLKLAIALPIFAVAAAVLLLSVIQQPPRLLAAGPLTATGRVSYGLYLYHLPLLATVGLIGLPIAILITVLSYRYVEQPFRRRRGGSSNTLADSSLASPS